MDKFTHNMNSPDAFEHRFKALSTAISGVVYSFNPDWSIMYELDGRGFLSDVTEPTADWKKRNVYREDIEKVDNAIAEAIKNKCVLELEHRVLKADRTVGWTFSRAVPILNDKGEIKEWFGVASDITERKLAEQSLKKSREILEQQKRTYETIISGTPDLMYVFDLNYRFTYANQALLQMWGKTWDEAVGKGLLENGYEPWHAEMHQQEIDTIKTTGKSIRGEVAFPHATLGRRLYDYILNPVFDEGGKVIAVSGTTRDVTERDQWEQKLKQSAERLQAINEEFAAVNEELSASNEEILAVNEDLAKANANLISAQQTIEEGKLALRQAIEAANFGTWYIHPKTLQFVTDSRLKELFGYLPDDNLTLEKALAQITDEYRDLIAGKLEHAIYSLGDFDVTYPVIGLHDNKLRWLRAIGNRIAEPNGEASGFTGVIMDITDQKMEEIRKNDFMGMVSHELKTPLTSLSAYLQLLEIRAKENPDDVSQRAISKSVQQTKRMTDMINGFLDFSRLESAKIIIETTPFDVAELIEEVKEETKMLYTTHKFIFASVKSQFVSADRLKIGQVLANLIGNAVKYSKPGSLIQVSCVALPNEVKFSVWDEGIGIKADDLSKIFERFYRVENNNLISGFGIGLYVSSEIIKMHKGAIWAESEVGKGSVFSFNLPIGN
ncbi:PAS domain S-box protein [Pedobacter sp. Leaf194]|uniref:PAS domain S-box protein n=1 Tax=Pedobacter sp. Leaf194 TaxID=1736297 RepID=UPI0007039789|nr:PAS domain S-box protein [Pedobacter sp. Leaf194]KQS35663.1 PAS domain-containing sensor histidine kinase [Pedobacter sp. Leaf194]